MATQPKVGELGKIALGSKECDKGPGTNTWAGYISCDPIGGAGYGSYQISCNGIPPIERYAKMKPSDAREEIIKNGEGTLFYFLQMLKQSFKEYYDKLFPYIDSSNANSLMELMFPLSSNDSPKLDHVYSNPKLNFGKVWRQIADSRDREKWYNIQHEYVRIAFFEYYMKDLSPKIQNVIRVSPTMQQVWWSTAFNHGPEAHVYFETYNAEEDLFSYIKKIYRLRIKKNPGEENKVRYEDEMKKALEWMKIEQKEVEKKRFAGKPEWYIAAYTKGFCPYHLEPLYPIFKTKLLAFINKSKADGVTWQIMYTLRTPWYQQFLYERYRNGGTATAEMKKYKVYSNSDNPQAASPDPDSAPHLLGVGADLWPTDPVTNSLYPDNSSKFNAAFDYKTRTQGSFELRDAGRNDRMHIELIKSLYPSDRYWRKTIGGFEWYPEIYEATTPPSE